MDEYVIDLDAASDFDIYADFPEVIYHFDIEERPIRIIKAYEWGGYSIGETVEHQDGKLVIEYFGTLDCDLSGWWSECTVGTPVIIVNKSGFALISEIKKVSDG